MAKPIFIVRFPIEIINSQGKERFIEITEQLKHQLTDYHVLSLYENNIDKVQFECYNNENDNINIEELKEKILSSIKT